MRFILKLAITSKTGNKRIDTFMTGWFKAVKDVLGNIPIIPLGNGKLLSYDLARDAVSKKLEENGITNYVDDLESEGETILNNSGLFGKNVTLTRKDVKNLTNAKNKVWDDPRAFIKASKELHHLPIFTSQEWNKLFEEWMKNLPDSSGDSNIQTLKDSTHTTLTAIRKDKNIRQAFWRLFGNGRVPDTDTIPSGPGPLKS